MIRPADPRLPARSGALFPSQQDRPYEKPTHVRWRIAGLLFVIITLTFIDRFNMNVAAHYMQREFAFSDIQVGGILSAFVLGYALFQVPGGMLGDRFGPRRVLTGAVLWWSAFTALTAVAPTLFLVKWFGVLGSICIIRFLIGVGEAPAFPNANKAIGMWMAPGERARGNSLFMLGIGVGGAFTPPLIAGMMIAWGWRATFYVFGAIGPVIALIWNCLATETPQQHGGVNKAELSLIGPAPVSAHRLSEIPWRRLFSSTTVWALAGSNLLLGYVSYIFYTWFFLYVVTVRKLPVMASGYWSTAPFLMMLIAAPTGGYFSDLMVKKVGHRWGRRIPVLSGAVVSFVFLIVGSRLTSPYAAILTLAVAGGCGTFISVTCWSLPNDLSRSFSGSLSGVFNMANNLGGAVSPLLTPAIATRFGWIAAFDTAAIAMLCMGALWLFVHPERSLDSPAKPRNVSFAD